MKIFDFDPDSTVGRDSWWANRASVARYGYPANDATRARVDDMAVRRKTDEHDEPHVDEQEAVVRKLMDLLRSLSR